MLPPSRTRLVAISVIRRGKKKRNKRFKKKEKMPRLHGSRSAFRGGVDQQPRRGLAARHPGKDQDRSFRKKKLPLP